MKSCYIKGAVQNDEDSKCEKEGTDLMNVLYMFLNMCYLSHVFLK
jgi:hypothetical protein